ncbi:MAG: SigE family RNA polymerase sigma factor [Nocardioides sp.]
MAGCDEERFRDFVIRRSPDLLRTAYLLTGDRGHAEDLLQTAFMKTHRHWSRLRNQEDPGAFVHRVMVTTRATSWRRRRVHERSTDVLPETTGNPEPELPDGTDQVWTTLAQLPPRMRAVLVLRYWEDRSEAETAQILECSVGTVKSQASRGLARLRTQLSAPSEAERETETSPRGPAT